MLVRYSQPTPSYYYLYEYVNHPPFFLFWLPNGMVMVINICGLFHHFQFHKKKKKKVLPSNILFWVAEKHRFFFFFSKSDKSQNILGKVRSVVRFLFLSWRKIFTERKQVTQKTAQRSSLWTRGYFEGLLIKWIFNSVLQNQRQLFCD